jgi:alkaline phosphatase
VPGDPAAGGPYTTPSTKKPKRNLIFMVSDGMGPASLSLTRSFRQFTSSLPIDDVLTLDRHFWGTSRTRSTNSLVTDSAAGATAFSCGRKSYNGAIGMLPGHKPCGTVLEAAKRAGFITGLVVTTDVTDATPACFASHVDYRMQMDEIALQEVGEGPLGRSVDLILGGGRCHFLPNGTEGSCRVDDVDVVGIAQEKHGWGYKSDRAGFDELRLGKNISLPMLGLFAAADVPFEIDRRNMADVYPSLSEMATTALTALEEATKDSDKGFFLMIEGSRIDHAGHINDPAAQVREVLEYDKTFKIVLDFLEKSDTEGILVATSDHETGGLATAWRKSFHSKLTILLFDANAPSRGPQRTPRLQLAPRRPGQGQRLRRVLLAPPPPAPGHIGLCISRGLGVPHGLDQQEPRHRPPRHHRRPRVRAQHPRQEPRVRHHHSLAHGQHACPHRLEHPRP